jgi:type VI protein secretion system component VasK
MANLDPRMPGDRIDPRMTPHRRVDYTGWYIGAVALALLIVGLLSWSAPDNRNDTANQSTQTETQQPKSTGAPNP